MPEQLEIKKAVDGSLIKTVDKYNEEKVFSMLQLAHETFLDKKTWLKHHQRIDILNKLAILVEKEAEEFAQIIALEGGKPLIDARIEVTRAIDGIKLATKDLMSVFQGKEIPMGFSKPSENVVSFTIKEPIGVVLAISAFNHPLNLIVHQIVPAIAVGCPVLVKPASSTPTACIRLVELIHQSGLDKKWCQYLIANNNIIEKIVADKRLGFFTFIGSNTIGWHLRNKLANGTRYSLEHGGSAPVIIDKEIEDIDKIVASIVKGGFYHAGQVCISCQRIFVHEAIFETFQEKIKSAVLKLNVGDPSLDTTEVGPLISSQEVTRVDTWINEAVNEGAKIICGGKKINDYFYEPTILVEVNENSKVSKEEIFGPVICLNKISSIDEAINKANSVDLPFQSAIFTKNIDNAMEMFYGLNSAGVIINEHSAFRVDWMPFAARKSAGYGIGGIYYTMEEMVQHKLMVIKSQGIRN